MTVINDPSMANVLSVPAAKPHLQQSQNYAQMHIDAANNNTSCQVYFEINSVLRHWWLRPRANWKTFSMYHHLLAFPIDIFLGIDIATYWDIATLLITNCKCIPKSNLTSPLYDPVWQHAGASSLAARAARGWGGIEPPKVFSSLARGSSVTQPPTPWNTRTNNKKRHGD